MPTRTMLAGRCSCGRLHYSVEDGFVYAGYCHCSQCRALSGAAFTAFAGIEKAKLKVTKGAEDIAIFEKNPDDMVNFCRLCGSVLFSVVRDGTFVHVTMGTLADDPAIRPTFHIFVGSKAPWHEITDALPQYQEHAPL
ncbi:MAG: GFA family protein [Geminicoccaceae bacterium]